MQDIIILFAFLTLFLILFNAWYTVYRVSKQTKQALTEFDLQLRRRLDLITELIEEIDRYVKKSPLQKKFKETAEKIKTASLPEVSKIVTEEIGEILSSAFKIAKKYPKLISSSKFSSIKSELAKIDEKIICAKEVYCKNVEFLQNWMDKFPFKRFKGFCFDIDKEQRKMESKKALEKRKGHWTENELEDFISSFCKPEEKKKKSPSKEKEIKRSKTKKVKKKIKRF